MFMGKVSLGYVRSSGKRLYGPIDDFKSVFTKSSNKKTSFNFNVTFKF